MGTDRVSFEPGSIAPFLSKDNKQYITRTAERVDELISAATVTPAVDTDTVTRWTHRLRATGHTRQSVV